MSYANPSGTLLPHEHLATPPGAEEWEPAINSLYDSRKGNWWAAVHCTLSPYDGAAVRLSAEARGFDEEEARATAMRLWNRTFGHEQES